MKILLPIDATQIIQRFEMLNARKPMLKNLLLMLNKICSECDDNMEFVMSAKEAEELVSNILIDGKRKRILSELCDMGIIVKVGGERSSRYRILPEEWFEYTFA